MKKKIQGYLILGNLVLDDPPYRKELIEHLQIVTKIKPSQVLWLLNNLKFKVSDVTKIWANMYE